MSAQVLVSVISVLLISAMNFSMVLCDQPNHNSNSNSLPLTPAASQQNHHAPIGHAEMGELENCGIIPPSVKHYIYGGKQSMIEQWPWQVRKN